VGGETGGKWKRERLGKNSLFKHLVSEFSRGKKSADKATLIAKAAVI